ARHGPGLGGLHLRPMLPAPPALVEDGPDVLHDVLGFRPPHPQRHERAHRGRVERVPSLEGLIGRHLAPGASAQESRLRRRGLRASHRVVGRRMPRAGHSRRKTRARDNERTRDEGLKTPTNARRWGVVLLFWAALPLVTSQAAAANAPGLDPRKALTQYGLDYWTTEDDLPQNSVTAIAQTRDGYLWFGTYGGLARFDGVRFAVYDSSNTEALQSNGVLALLEARDGVLWIGTNGGGLSRYEDGRFATYTVANGLANDIVRTLYEDRA